MRQQMCESSSAGIGRTRRRHELDDKAAERPVIQRPGRDGRVVRTRSGLRPSPDGPGSCAWTSSSWTGADRREGQERRTVVVRDRDIAIVFRFRDGQGRQKDVTNAKGDQETRFYHGGSARRDCAHMRCRSVLTDAEPTRGRDSQTLMCGSQTASAPGTKRAHSCESSREATSARTRSFRSSVVVLPAAAVKVGRIAVRRKWSEA